MGLPSTSGWINIDFHLSFMPIKLELGIKAFLRGAGSVLQKKLEKIRPIVEKQP